MNNKTICQINQIINCFDPNPTLYPDTLLKKIYDYNGNTIFKQNDKIIFKKIYAFLDNNSLSKISRVSLEFYHNFESIYNQSLFLNLNLNFEFHRQVFLSKLSKLKKNNFGLYFNNPKILKKIFWLMTKQEITLCSEIMSVLFDNKNFDNLNIYLSALYSHIDIVNNINYNDKILLYNLIISILIKSNTDSFDKNFNTVLKVFFKTIEDEKIFTNYLFKYFKHFY